MTEKKNAKKQAPESASEPTNLKAKPKKAKPKKSIGFWIGLTTGTLVVASIGGVWIYGNYVFPAQQRANLAEKDLAACNLFYDGLNESKKDLKDAMNKVLKKVNDAITLYDPTFTDQDPQFGKVYEAMLRVADVGVSGLDFPELAAENFNKEITRAEEICYAVQLEARANKLKEETNNK